MTDTPKPEWKLTWTICREVEPVEQEGGMISIGEVTFTAADLTGQHAALLALIYKDESWEPLGRSPLDGPVDLMAYLTAFVAIASARDALEVQIELAGVPLVDLMAAVSVQR